MKKLLLRRNVLMQLEAASPASLPYSTILQGLLLAGFSIDAKTLSAELDYLSEKEMLKIEVSKISAGQHRAKLSATGRDYLESGDF